MKKTKERELRSGPGRVIEAEKWSDDEGTRGRDSLVDRCNVSSVTQARPDSMPVFSSALLTVFVRAWTVPRSVICKRIGRFIITREKRRIERNARAAQPSPTKIRGRQPLFCKRDAACREKDRERWNTRSKTIERLRSFEHLERACREFAQITCRKKRETRDGRDAGSRRRFL